MSDEPDLALIASVGPRRIQILELIWTEELSVGEIASRVPVSMAAVSQHLGKMRAAGLVSVRREGRRRYYRAVRRSDDPLGAALEAMWPGEPQPAPSPAPVPTGTTRSPRHRPPGTEAPPSELGPGEGVPQAPGGQLDEMRAWYRQGLRGRLTALEAARRDLKNDPQEATRTTYRVARSLTRTALTERFPEVGETARSLLATSPEALEYALGSLIGAIRQASVSDDSTDVRILIVEDSRVESLLYRSIIAGPNREVLTASTADEARGILADRDVSLVLLDLGLPGADGRDLLIELGQRPRTAAIPVILLTGRTDALTRMEVLSLGADAFYQKPVVPGVLSTAVAMTLERAAEARQLGRHDPLTGLRNRGVFMQDVRQLAATAARAAVPLSVALVNLRGLASVNERHGSGAGDDVVRKMASVLRECFRASDLIARWEGSQFAILFSNTSPHGASIALEKLRKATDELSVPMPDGSALEVTWQGGVASIRDPAAVDDTIARATRRLHVARRPHGPSVVWEDVAAEDRTHTVVVVEDDEILADLIEHRLRREGFEIVRFADGSEAVTALVELDPSAVVADTNLPGVDGFEILRRLKETPSYAGVPVILLTFGSERDTARALRLGASDSLAKPFAVEELVARVARLVSAFEEGTP